MLSIAKNNQFIMILNGRKIALKMYDEMSWEISKHEKKPTLWAILVGDNSSSLRYIKQKRKWAEYVGINFQLLELQEDISEEDLLRNVEKYNLDTHISGFIIQLPLPKSIDTQKIMRAILPEKDVDGFHPVNQWKILLWDNSGLIPCTPAGIMKLLSSQNIDVSGKKVVVIGRSNIVGKPLVNLLMNAGATVTNCNSKTPDITPYTKQADIVISATGVPKMIGKEHVSQDAIIIDVWFSVIDGKATGDTDVEALDQNGNLVTPVPGWVGPMTVAMLIHNTLLTHKRQLWVK